MPPRQVLLNDSLHECVDSAHTHVSQNIVSRNRPTTHSPEERSDQVPELAIDRSNRRKLPILDFDPRLAGPLHSQPTRRRVVEE